MDNLTILKLVEDEEQFDSDYEEEGKKDEEEEDEYY